MSASKLSGGQRTANCYCKSAFERPSAFILDEATSALDSESEQLVQEALERLMKGRTSVVIAHRLSTIRNADQILVLNEGEVSERGSHDELIDQGGIMPNWLSYKMWRRRQMNYQNTQLATNYGVFM